MSTPLPAHLKNGAVRLSDWGVIEVQGADAATFLHGQLTQNVLTLSPQRARLAGYCSPKGRLLASFVAWRPEADTIALACSADVLAATLKRLSMFVLRAKCKLSDASSKIAVWGLVGAEAGQWLGGDVADAPAWACGQRGEGESSGHWIRLPDADSTPRWLWMASAVSAGPNLAVMDPSYWAWLEVRSGLPRIVAATSDHFVPQMVNFELVGGVDFQKGCYPGQEIVARSQYRGTLKRRMVLMNTTAQLAPGAEVFHASDPGQPAGEVVLAAAAPDGSCAALVEIKLAMRDQSRDSIHFSSAGADLREDHLPYDFPAEAS